MYACVLEMDEALQDDNLLFLFSCSYTHTCLLAQAYAKSSCTYVCMYVCMYVRG